MKRVYRESLYKIFVSLFIVFYSFVPNGIAIAEVVNELQGDSAAPVEVEIIGEDESQTLLVSTVVQSSPYEPVYSCVNDLQGANDQPGQKDLNQMCIDENREAEGILYVTWNWDEIQWSGGNTGDACSLFDTDGDGYANYSLCVIVGGNPATYQNTILYSCGDASANKCTNPISVIDIKEGTDCTAGVVNETDPFSGPAAKDKGDDYPYDTVASCMINLDDVGGVSDAYLLDVCSYPSSQPNSDPSDCIRYAPKQGLIEVKKELIPITDNGKFNLLIDGGIEAQDIGDGGSTGEISLSVGTYRISETAGTGTNLALYDSSIQCKDSGGAIIVEGQDTYLDVPVGEGEDILCTITNSRLAGSIQVNKYLDRDGNGSFEESNPNDFTWSINGSGTYAMGNKVDGLATGKYSINENIAEEKKYEFVGWYPNTAAAEVSCTKLPDGDIYTKLPISVDVLSDVTTEITICNTAIPGKLTIKKTANPVVSDSFNIEIVTTDGYVKGSNTGVITDSNDYSYTVGVGTYSINETVPEGWYIESNTCKNITVGAGEEKECTITNTKYASVSGYKINDLNGNGKMDAGEEGLEGWTIYIDSNNNEKLDAGEIFDTTDSSGAFSFTNLIPGDYILREELKVGWIVLGGNMISVTLIAGQDLTDQNFHNFQNAKIYGYKFNDLNGNGVWDEKEPPIKDWLISLYVEIAGGSDSHVADKRTDENGYYEFIISQPGKYNVLEELPVFWYPTLPLSGGYSNIVPTSGQEIRKDFGNFELGEIKACKYEDYTGNGKYEASDDIPLSGIDIKLYEYIDEDWSYSETLTTSTDGCVTFSKLELGKYKVEEDYNDPDLDGYYSTNGITYYDDIQIYSGSKETRVFLNAKYRTISGTKFNDINGNGVKDDGELGLKGWTIYIEGNANGKFDTGEIFTVTDQDGYYEFTGLVSDSYRIAEHMSLAQINAGWSQTLPTLGYYDIDLHIEITSFDNDFGNVQLSDIHGYKWEDLNGDGYRNCADEDEMTLYPIYFCEEWAEPLLSDWTINLYKWNVEGYDSEPIETMDTDDGSVHFGWYWFEDLLPGKYKICEVLEDGWGQSFPSGSCHEVELPQDGTNPFTLNMIWGPEYNFGNYVVSLPLEISKENDSDPLGMYAGEIVTYTITVTAPEREGEQQGTYIIRNVKVVDILPPGFTYVLGSWTSTVPTTQPVYPVNAPGVWEIGDMEEGDTVILTYQALISSIQEIGTYKDIAYTYGDSLLGEGDVLGVSTTDSSTNFVGTEVLVIEDPEIEEGEVLGAAIQLPATGADTYLTIGALVSMLIGFFLLVFKPSKKMKSLVMAGVLLLGIFTLVKPNTIYAEGGLSNDIDVRIAVPEALTNQESFDIGFVVLDLKGRPFTVQCIEETYGLFDTHTTNSGSCKVDNSVITTSGIYKFHIVVNTTSGTPDMEKSNIVTVQVDLTNPSAVQGYSKTEGVCSYTLKFKTANDGKTSKIQIFRSDKQPFTANSTTLINEMTVGPNVEVTYTDTPLPSCSKEYYYAIRSVDEFSNVSPLVTDDIVTVVPATTTTTTTTATTTPTTPVDTGEVEGETTVDGTDEDENGDVKGDEDVTDENGEEGEEEETDEEKASFWDEYKYLIFAIGIVLLGGVGYWYVKGRRK